MALELQSLRLPTKTAANPAPVMDAGCQTPSLDRALAILECISAHPKGITQTELAEKLRLSGNLIFRTAKALEVHGYVWRDAVTRRYSLSPKMIAMSTPVAEDRSLVECALPAMREISARTGESSHLGVRVGLEGVVLERVIGPHLVKYYVDRGTRFPLHTSAPGKLMLAFLPETECDALIDAMTLERFNDRTLTTKEALRDVLAETRARGWATDLGEHIEGHHCAGTAVFDREGRPVASLWITGPSSRLTETIIRDAAGLLVEAGKRATRQFGGMWP